MIQEIVLPPAFHRDPTAARFITDDLARFWQAFEHLDAPDAERVFEALYLDAGTDGLHAFTASRIETATHLVRKVRSCRAYYAALSPGTNRVETSLPAIRAAYVHLASLYDEAVFPDTTFVMGRLSSGGTIADAGLLIGTEFFTRDAMTPVHELSAWELGTTQNVAALPFIVAHELIHAQQFVALQGQLPEAPTLLWQCLLEGAAEYIGAVISGRVTTPALHAYGRAHEAALWARFEQERHQTSWEGWLYEGDRTDGIPADLGYFVGARICEAYVARQQDRRVAVKDVIVRALDDPEGFLLESGYASKIEALQKHSGGATSITFKG